MKKVNWPTYLSDGNHKDIKLERIMKFLNVLGNPQNKIPPVFHVAGSNGKGSTTAFLKYILEAEGYLVHRYTSPHLVELNERIEVSSKIISDEYLIELSAECEAVSKKTGLSVSYFEGLTVMAFLAFSRNPAVATILEVGMGGRLDATNVVKDTLAGIITPISLEHTKILGSTIAEIAGEKAGIVKENSTLIIDNQPLDAYDVIHRICAENNNKIYACDHEWSVKKLENSFIFEGFGKKLELPLPGLSGEHQIYNAGGAIAALLSQDKIKVSDESIREGIENVKWPGRLQNMSDNGKLMQFLPKGSELFIDGAHNEGGAVEIIKWMNGRKNKKYNILITGILARKNSLAYLEIMKNNFDFIIAVDIIGASDESKKPEEIADELRGMNYDKVISLPNFIEALKYIEKNFNGIDLVVLISGSLYLIGDVLEYSKESNIAN